MNSHIVSKARLEYCPENLEISEYETFAIFKYVPVVVCIESCVIEVKEPQPVPPGDRGVAADSIVLVTQPHHQNNVECCGRILYNQYSNENIGSKNNTSKNSDIIASIPTKARMTVNKGAAGNVILVLNSSICRRSTMKTNIWC